MSKVIELDKSKKDWNKDVHACLSFVSQRYYHLVKKELEARFQFTNNKDNLSFAKIEKEEFLEDFYFKVLSKCYPENNSKSTNFITNVVDSDFHMKKYKIIDCNSTKELFNSLSDIFNKEQKFTLRARLMHLNENPKIKIFILEYRFKCKRESGIMQSQHDFFGYHESYTEEIMQIRNVFEKTFWEERAKSGILPNELIANELFNKIEGGQT